MEAADFSETSVLW